jgi:hypothetical protein
MQTPDDVIVEQGRLARREGQPLGANPWFGGGKVEAANQWKWELGWKEENEQLELNRSKQLPNA